MLLQLIPTATGLQLQVFADNNNITLDANNTSLTLAGGKSVTTNLNGSTITITAETSICRHSNQTRCKFRWATKRNCKHK